MIFLQITAQRCLLCLTACYAAGQFTRMPATVLMPKSINSKCCQWKCWRKVALRSRAPSPTTQRTIINKSELKAPIWEEKFSAADFFYPVVSRFDFFPRTLKENNWGPDLGDIIAGHKDVYAESVPWKSRFDVHVGHLVVTSNCSCCKFNS